MKRYRVTHTTGFEYTGDAVASYNEARMLPLKSDSQIVFSSRLEITPSTSSFEHVDFFGTRVTTFEVLEHHRELTIVSQSLVEIRPLGELIVDITWDHLSALGSANLVLADALAQTRRTEPSGDVVRFAKKAAARNSPHRAALEISQFVFEKMSYKSGVTGVHSVAKEAWSSKVGVCQDYAHILLGALRSVGIPARYVSGYFHPEKEPKLHATVQAESHAWVEWYVGGLVNDGWFAYDPTNNIEVIDRHIAVGKARDYDDLAPLRGVYAGAMSSELKVGVEITREA